MKNVIYYFSGTGNSLALAKDIAGKLGDTQLIPVNHYTLKMELPQADRVGFVYPVYFFGLPRMMMDFITKLNIARGTYCFAVADMGGTDVISLLQVERILASKGLKLSYGVNRLMPGNYILMYPTTAENKQAELFGDAKKAVVQISEDINNNVLKSTPKHPWVLNAFAEIVYQIGYNKKKTDHNFWSTDDCINCGICAKICPSANITLPKGKPVWNHDCHQCLACIHWCPKAAIQYKKATLTRGRYHHPDVKVEEMFPDGKN